MASRLRPARSYARRAPTREPYDYVLIVCEGGKTEPYYFNSLIAAERLSSANIHVISGNGHTDPMSIVSIAESYLDKEYDKIYCVFDRNGHANYDQALNRIANQEAGRIGRLRAVTSWPCFEVWLLLHFAYSAAPFQRTGKNSPCDNVIRQLKRHLNDYEKGRETIFEEILPRLEVALRNSRRLSRDNEDTGTTNPSTRTHELVNYLRNLKNR